MNRVLDISDSAASLRSENGLLVIKAENLDARIPFEEIAVLILANNRILVSQKTLFDLASVNGIMLVCDDKFQPSAMLVPLVGNFEQTKKMSFQASASVPIKKQIWKTIVRAKIHSQANVLHNKTGDDAGLLELSERIRSGDPDNLEAVAAARYWKRLFGDGFIRHNEDFRNSALNFGYAILRSMTARCLCASGLHPSLGVHHKNQRNPFCLADDLMEPFRPLVDRIVFDLEDWNQQITKETKQALLSKLLGKFDHDGGQKFLFDVLLQVSQSLAKHFVENTPFSLIEVV